MHDHNEEYWSINQVLPFYRFFQVLNMPHKICERNRKNKDKVGANQSTSARGDAVRPTGGLGRITYPWPDPKSRQIVSNFSYDFSTHLQIP